LLVGNLRQNLRARLQDRYGVPRVQQELNQYSEQMAYGHREVLINYMELPQDAYFEAILTHGKILPNRLDPIRPQFSRDGAPLLQALWRADAEEESKELHIANVFSIGATGLYELNNLGVGINQVKENINFVASNHEWSENRGDLIDKFAGKKILYMPTHSWDGDVVEHSIGKVNFLKKLESKNVTVCLGYLDFSDPSVRRIYSQSGWKIECAGVRASKVFGSPAGGRANFLKELFRILDESDIVVADELTTGQMYAACLGREIGLLPEEYSVTFSYSKWQSSSDFGNFNREIRALYPWLVGKKATSEKICADISQALGVDKFKDPARLMNILPWRQEEILRKVR